MRLLKTVQILILKFVLTTTVIRSYLAPVHSYFSGQQYGCVVYRDVCWENACFCFVIFSETDFVKYEPLWYIFSKAISNKFNIEWQRIVKITLFCEIAFGKYIVVERQKQAHLVSKATPGNFVSHLPNDLPFNCLQIL